MYVFIARHAESLATLNPDLMGQMDPCQIPLTTRGQNQSADMGRVISGIYHDDERFRGRRLRIYSSQHCRISETSDAISSQLPPNIISGVHVDENLRQRDHGLFDGLSRDGKKNLNPTVYAKLHSDDPLERYTTKMPEGESFEQVEIRLRQFVQILQRDMSMHEDALLVCHGPHCRLLQAILTHSDPVVALDAGTYGTGHIVMVETNLRTPGNAKVIYDGE